MIRIELTDDEVRFLKQIFETMNVRASAPDAQFIVGCLHSVLEKLSYQEPMNFDSVEMNGKTVPIPADVLRAVKN